MNGPFSFPDTVVTDTSLDQNVYLMNGGLADLQISGITLTGDAADFEKDAWCDTVTLTPGKPGNFCSFAVRFKPQQGGLRQAQLVISSDDANSPHVVNLSGKGLQGVLQPSPSPLLFGTVYGGYTSTKAKTLVKLAGNGQFPPALAAPPADDRNFVRGGVMSTQTCLLGSQGPLTFNLPIGRAMGAVSAAVASGVLRPTGELEIAATWTRRRTARWSRSTR